MSGALQDAARDDVVLDDAALDEMLTRLHDQEPRIPQGLSTHAPMAAEALLAEHALRPDPAHLAAAEDAVARL